MAIIGHVDMDAFFAAIEERDRPRLKGRPIVVGADPREGRGRGVVATANYKAREFGIRSAMPISRAWRLAEEARAKGAPATVFIGGHHGRYGVVSARVMAIVAHHALRIEQASIDEAYFSFPTESVEEAARIAKKIKTAIQRAEKLTCSIGVGPNKLIAKIASGQQKPDGFTLVRAEDAKQFLEPFAVRVIPGIGPKSERVLTRHGITTVKELKTLTRARLCELFGAWGGELYHKARGIGSDELAEEEEAKSIGEQTTFDEDTRSVAVIEAAFQELAYDVHRRFYRDGFLNFKMVAITVRFDDFETKTRARTLEKLASDARTILFEALRLAAPFLDARENPKRKAIRLVGVRVEKLNSALL